MIECLKRFWCSYCFAGSGCQGVLKNSYSFDHPPLLLGSISCTKNEFLSNTKNLNQILVSATSSDIWVSCIWFTASTLPPGRWCISTSTRTSQLNLMFLFSPGRNSLGLSSKLRWMWKYRIYLAALCNLAETAFWFRLLQGLYSTNFVSAGTTLCFRRM